jgi:hypothetical protein
MWKPGLPLLAQLGLKYEKHWSRIRKERILATIITNPHSVVWPRETRKVLIDLMKRVAARPECDGEWAQRHRREIYQFLGKYEMTELLKERKKFFQFP